MAHCLEEHGRGQDLEGILQAVDAAIIGAGLAQNPDDDFDDDEEESIWDYTPPPSELY